MAFLEIERRKEGEVVRRAWDERERREKSIMGVTIWIFYFYLFFI